MSVNDPKKIAEYRIAMQQSIVSNGQWQCCGNCENWNIQNKGCNLVRQTPPIRVIINGCENWQQDIPF